MSNNVVFERGQVLGRQDLNITLSDGADHPVNPVEVYCTLFDFTTGLEVQVGPHKIAPENPSVGEFFAPISIPTDANVGNYRLRWYFKRSQQGPLESALMPFAIIARDGSPLFGTTLTPAQQSLVRSLRYMLRDNNPDRNYHFRPPTHQESIGQFNRVFGYLWEDDELAEFLDRSLDMVAASPPHTPFPSVDALVSWRKEWSTVLITGASIYALQALAINWISEEFDYSIGGVSLSLERASKYESAKDSMKTLFDDQLEKAKQTVKIIKGLQQPKFGTGLRSSFGPYLGRGLMSPSKFAGFLGLHVGSGSTTPVSGFDLTSRGCYIKGMAVTCPHCQTTFPTSTTINARHKAACPGWQALLGDTTPRPCLCGHEAKSSTQMKRHRAVCATWKARDRGEVQMARLAETLQANHGVGVTHPRDVEGAEDRRKATVQERYGAESVFSKKSSVFNKVQVSLEGKRPVMRGADNPFAQPEVQAKSRATNLERYGVEHVAQSPEVRARTQATNLERYGVIEALAAPEVRAKIEATNTERYGGLSPMASPVVVEKARQTNLARWGVEWTGQHPDIRDRQLATVFARYGGHFLASEEGKAKVREACIKVFGVPHPMQVPAIAYKALQSSLTHREPNLLERRFASSNPELLYTGSGTFWRWLPLLGHHKNPDFICPGPDAKHPKRGVTRVVEVFGDYWHSKLFTGRANFEHESDLVAAYAEQGISCLIVWEGEFEADPQAVRARVLAHLQYPYEA